MKVTLLAVVVLTAVVCAGAADPECVYRNLRGLSPHWPNPASCTSYYRCSAKNTVRSVSCPTGKEYNPKNGKCGNAGRGLCKLSLTAPLADVTNICANEVSGAYLPNINYCGEFYICNDQLAYPQSCSAGSYFDVTTTNCIPDDDMHCWQNFCIGKADGIAIADTSSCSTFYLCYDQKATAQNCPVGSFFDVSGWNCQPGTCPTDNDSTTTESCTEETTVPTTEPCVELETTTATPCKDCANGVLNGDLVANTENCRLYYICSDGVLVAGDCLTGNFFDTTIGVCMPDTLATCPESGSAVCTNGAIAKDADNCAQYFECKEGAWQQMSCESGFYFDDELGTCCLDVAGICPASIAIAECPENAIVASMTSCWHYKVCINSNWQEQACGIGQYFDSAIKVCKTDDNGICPENKLFNMRSKRSTQVEGCVGGIPDSSMVSHPTNCEQYLICQNQQLVEGTCGQGNVFNNCTNVCEPDTGGSCWICNNRPNGYVLANPDKCNGYYSCFNGLTTEISCADGEWFNGYACVIDVTAACINPCDCELGQSANVANPICSKYYLCKDGVAQVMDCAAGQGFNSITGTCSAKVECNANLCSKAANGTTYSVAGDDKKFYVCMDYEATIRSCPANAAYNTTLNICLAQPSCSCDQTKCTDINEEYLPFPSLTDDSSTFCLCRDGSAYLEDCATGEAFDEDAGICLFTGPCDPTVCVDQEEYYISPNYDDPNSFCLCRAQQPVSVPCPYGYTFKNGLCTIVPLPDPRCCSTFCVDKADNLAFPSLGTNTGFCLCEEEVPIYEECPPNKIFDADLLICLDSEDESPNCACDVSQCDVLQEYDPYAALNTTTGFCYCKEYKAIYADCLNDMTFDVDLKMCLEPEDESINCACDVSQCDVLQEYDPYAALNTTTGFCYCEAYRAKYADCKNGMTFDVALKMCLQPEDTSASCACDAAQCDIYSIYEPFPALNGTNGFCYCTGVGPIYRPCLNELQFDKTLGICSEPVDECTSSYCDATKCSCLPESESFPSSKEDDPSGFCYCVNGEAIYDSCLGSKVFNAEQKMCLLEEAPCSVCDSTKCAALPDDATFAALNGTTGLCLCDGGQVFYQTCPNGKEYDSELAMCLQPVKQAMDNGFCDARQCRISIAFDHFAAINTTSGFCSCDEVTGTVVYQSCDAGKIFDSSLAMCIYELVSCASMNCDGRVSYAPFAVTNTTSGFCSCDESGVATYQSCGASKLFDISLSMCVTEEEHSLQKRSVEAEENLPCRAQEIRSVPANCSQFEICVATSWHRRSCPDQTYYNPEQQRCLQPRDDMVCSYARVSGLPPCTNHTESQTLASKNGNCLQYFRCVQQKWRLRSCPKNNHYAHHLRTCVPSIDTGDNLCEQERKLESSICQHTTVRPAPTGCANFLMCLENAWWYQQCPLGMYFSNELNYCVPNDAAQCNETEQLVQISERCLRGQRRAFPINCTAYEECQSNGRWTRHTCAATLQFDQLVNQCVPGDDSCRSSGLRRACHPGELRPHPLAGNCSHFYYCDADLWRLGSCLKGHTWANELGACVPHAVNNKCQPVWQHAQQLASVESHAGSCLDQADGVAVPHAEDCTRFYLCIKELPTSEQSCAVGSFFDASLGYCRPNDGSCRLALTGVCAGASDGELVANIENCHAYYNCSNHNVTELLYCPAGEYFHNVTMQCSVDHGQCVPQQEDLEQTKCTGLEHGTRIAHELYCNLYYACVRGLAIPVECPEQQLFNALMGECTHDPLRQCQDGQLVDNNTVYGCGSTPDGTYLADKIDCTRYFICVEGVALPQRCGAKAFFDSEQLLCLPDDGSCPYVNDDEPTDQNVPPDPVVCEGKHGYILPDLANCNNFYICVSSKLRHERCYSSYFFNATLKQCQLMDSAESDLVEVDANENATMKNTVAQCKDEATKFADLCDEIAEGTSIAEQGDCRRYISCEEDEPVSQRCRNGESYDSLLGICRQNDGTCLMENGERVGICNGKHGLLARDVDNCRGYFVCVHGQKIESECEEGEFFSKTTTTCEKDVLQQCNNANDETLRKSE